MFTQIGGLVDVVSSFFVFVLLAGFIFSGCGCVPQPGRRVRACHDQLVVVPARRAIPGLAGLDPRDLLLAWMVQALGLCCRRRSLVPSPASA